eukprot:2095-Heterococcus_DN1.PRE.2
MLLAVCGGNAGDKDELCSGNGDVDASKKQRYALIRTLNLANGISIVHDELRALGPHPGSAELHPQVAAEASYKIFTEDMPARGFKKIPESAYTALIRAACKGGEPDRALHLLNDMKQHSVKPRVRCIHAVHADVKCCKVSQKLRFVSNLHCAIACALSQRSSVTQARMMTYTPLLAVCAEAGRLDDCMTLWESALSHKLCLTEREYLSLITVCTHAKDKQRFAQVVSNYMEDVLRPRSLDSWAVIRAWFEQDDTWSVKGKRNLKCQVAPTGVCSCCGRVLQSIELSEDMVSRLLTQVAELVCSNEYRRKQWATYTDWIAENGQKFDVLIDGANIGYYKKSGYVDGDNFADHVQIDWVVQHYAAQGKRALVVQVAVIKEATAWVVLHSRHLQENRLSPECCAVLQKWKEQAIRIGGRVLVVTNDEMRDHHFQMLSHRSFQRWKERHQVHFGLGEWRGNAREILVSEPSVYSKRIQCTPAGDCWHFPLENSEQWLCISQAAATAVPVATAADATCAEHDTAANNGTSSTAAAAEACSSASAPHAAAIT